MRDILGRVRIILRWLVPGLRYDFPSGKITPKAETRKASSQPPGEHYRRSLSSPEGVSKGRLLLPLLLVCLAASPATRPEYEMVVQSGHSMPVQVVRISRDSRLILTASDDHTARLWTFEGKLLKTLEGHSAQVWSAEFSPDGQSVLTGSWDKTARLWSIDGHLLKVFQGHSGQITTAKFSPDGRRILTSSRDKTARLWSTDGRLIKSLEGHSEEVYDAVFSPDAKEILTASGDTTARIWSAKGELIKVLSGHSGEVYAALYSADGSRILTVSNDKTARIWSSEGALLKVLEGHSGGISKALFSADGSLIVTASYDATARLWTREGELLKVFRGHTNAIINVIFSPDGRQILTTSWDKTARLWSITGELLKTFSGHKYHIPGGAFSPDGKWIFTASFDKTVRMWSATGSQARVLPTYANIMRRAVFSPDGRRILILAREKVARLLSADGELLKVFEGHTMEVYSAVFSHDGKQIVTASEDKTARLWSADGELIRVFEGHTGSVYGASFSPDDSKVLTFSSDKTARLWSVDGKFCKPLAGHKNQVIDGVFSPNGQYILTASIDGSAFIWSLGAELLYRHPGHNLDLTVSFSPDSRHVITASGDTSARLWSIQGDLLRIFKIDGNVISKAAISPDGQLILTMHKNMVGLWTIGGKLLSKFADADNGIFSPDGQKVLTSSSDRKVRIWSRAGELLRIFEGHSGNIFYSIFSQDGRSVLTTSLDGTTKFWSAETGLELFSFLSFEVNCYIVLTPDGYWDGTPDSGRLVAMVKGLEAFGVDQFAIRNNRPDIILERLGGKDQARIEHFHDLYQARLKKFGITEADLSGELHAPEAKIVETKMAGKFAEVKFSLNDSKYDLHSYNIFVNDVPLFASGKRVTGKTGTITEKIELTSGENKIEVSVLNSKYVESIRALTFASYQPKEPVKGDLYFIGFGVSKYQNSKFDLKYAASDADNMEKTLKKMKGKGYREVHAHVYRDKDVTPETIRAAKKLLANARPDDTFVLFISGHGKHDSDKGATYYYLTHNADLNNLAGTAAKFELIEDLLHGIGPRQKLFLMDTCESGETDEGNTQKYLAWAAARKAKGVHARAIPSARGLATSEAPKPVRSYLHERDRFIYNDLMRRSGAIVFSSSRGGEFSYEDDAMQAGYFTKAILDGLGGAADTNKDGKVAIDELKQYTSKTVQKWSDGLQNPTVDRDNIYQKIVLPVVR